MSNPLFLALSTAPIDSEELTPETIEAIREGEASLARGERISHADVLREFGLAPMGTNG